MAPEEASLLLEIKCVLDDEKPLRKELQRLAKLCGIKANAKNVVILDQLRARLAAAPPPQEEEVEDLAAPVAAPVAAPAAAPAAVAEPAAEPVAEPAVGRRRSSVGLRRSLSAEDVEATRASVADAVEVVRTARRLSLERRESVDARRAATSAARGARSAKKAADRNRERSVAAVRAAGAPSAAKHREGAAAVVRPPSTRWFGPGGAKGAAAPPAPAAVPWSAAKRPKKTTAFAPFNLNVANRAADEAPAKLAWDASVGPADPPPPARVAPKATAPHSAARDARRSTAQSASKSARAAAAAKARC